MHKDLLHVGTDIEPSSLEAQSNVLGTDVVCTEQLAEAVNDLCPT